MMKYRFVGIFGLIAAFSLLLCSCGGNRESLHGWQVEVILLEKGPIPSREEIQEHKDILVGHRYRMISATPLKTGDPSLLVEELTIFQKLAVIDELQVGGKGKLQIHRWADRTDLHNRFTKQKFEVASERPIFVVTDA